MDLNWGLSPPSGTTASDFTLDIQGTVESSVEGWRQLSLTLGANDRAAVWLGGRQVLDVTVSISGAVYLLGGVPYAFRVIFTDSGQVCRTTRLPVDAMTDY